MSVFSLPCVQGHTKTLLDPLWVVVLSFSPKCMCVGVFVFVHVQCFDSMKNITASSRFQTNRVREKKVTENEKSEYEGDKMQEGKVQRVGASHG